jgi:hypothetical protein
MKNRLTGHTDTAANDKYDRVATEDNQLRTQASAPRRNRTYNLVIKSQFVYGLDCRVLSYMYVAGRFAAPSEQIQKRQVTSERDPKAPRKSPRMPRGHGCTWNSSPLARRGREKGGA